MEQDAAALQERAVVVKDITPDAVQPQRSELAINPQVTIEVLLILHGTSGTALQWLVPEFANETFAPGKPLDGARYYVIMPDGIGRGGSARPSDGLKMAFPHYRYADMVRAAYRQLMEGLSVTHLRLVMGASMGDMQAWMWAGMYPDFTDVAMSMAS